ncbi:PRUNE [Lepeophtheirus salmonis]|uniref:PRUNE n=1 Tax=Lepeophtheirus salmonis TaxID=72036 RepID=A0A7R8HE53_LEPSM|nr:PRUNE [Lepeophtheirus salmonis]CAF3036262.1 PRUNE [Lepeophtheirus salmonis]
MSLLSFVKGIRDRMVSTDQLHVILGNESLDLDSAVCSIVYAHSQQSSKPPTSSSLPPPIPVLNVERKDLSLKTEVLFCLRVVGIDPSFLICKDEFNFENKTELITLVDHHVLCRDLGFLKDKIHKIFDHRPLVKEKIPQDVELKHSLVGSCSSLITSTVLNANYRDPIGLKLLYDAILTDTMNLSKETNVTTPLDVEAVERIETTLCLSPESRSTEFESIMKAKRDIGSFTTHQLLRRDLKMILNGDGDKKVSLSSIFLSLSALRETRSNNFFVDLKSFLEENKLEFSVVTGLYFPKDVMTRELIIYAKSPGVIMDLKDLLNVLLPLELECD